MTKVTPFHEGEREAQRRAGVESMARSADSFIRNYMPEQHRDFFAQLPFMVMAAGDEKGRPWVTMLEGEEAFIRTPDAQTLAIAASLSSEDPLAPALTPTLAPGMAVGLLGIELATRRRNRLNGMIRSADGGLIVGVQQSFGNCPQYIREREWRRVESTTSPSVTVSDSLDANQRAWIETADTFFIGSGTGARAGDATQESLSEGYDASHRGGEPGFVRVTEDGALQIPDYSGNNFFNTIGNLIRDPRVGLLFVDFETGGMLQVTGRASIDWAPKESHDSNAKRMIDVTVEQVVDRPAALALRWHREAETPLRLEVVDKVDESDQITSFRLADTSGGALPPFEAGQHLAVELEVPGQSGRVRRSYSLSGSPFVGTYRLGVKREANGIASRFLHDQVQVGGRIAAHRPSGDFVLPRQQQPLVLVSAGVGITPMLSMLHAVVAEAEVENRGRPVWFVHGARDGGAHAFRKEIDALVAQSESVAQRVFYSVPHPNDTAGIDYDVEGRITAEELLGLGAGPDAHYLLCGPARFLADISAGLEAGGVAADRIGFETFGPAG